MSDFGGLVLTLLALAVDWDWGYLRRRKRLGPDIETRPEPRTEEERLLAEIEALIAGRRW